MTVHRSRLCNPGQDGKLASGAGPVELLATHGGVVDECSNVNIIIRALTSLVVGAEAPGVGLPIGRDGDGVVRFGRDE